MSDPGPSTPIELLRALAVMAEPPTDGHAGLGALLGFGGTVTGPAYSDVFLFQLYPYASVHLGEEGMMGGEARERVAGFWHATGRVPPAEPDHLSALLGFYATLSEAVAGRSDAEGALLDRARLALLYEHLAPWVFAFLWRVEELCEGVYAEWATLLGEVLRAEVCRGELTALEELPVHLARAPEVPDPRAAGGAPFIGALLAPVRSGTILTRADLARIAGELGLGLRAGERRYALEHLLAQEAGDVLVALSTEVGRQSAAHQARAEWLGRPAHFLCRRADATAALLLDLASDVAAEDLDGAVGEAATAHGGG